MQPIFTLITILTIGLATLHTRCLAESSPDVPLSHPIYSAIDRADARGLTAQPLPGARPYSEADLAGWSKHLLSQGRLTKAEGGAFHRYLAETTSDGERSNLVTGKFYGYADEHLQLRANPIFRQTVHIVDDDTDAQIVSQTRVGMAVSGSFRDRFAFRVQHFEAREWSDLARTARSDVWAAPIETVQLKGQSVDFRESQHQLKVTFPWFEADIGKQSFDWGPSREANVFLHDAAPSFAYARVNFKHKALSFQHVFGALRTPPGDLRFGTVSTSNGHTRRILPPKRIVAHRLELAVSERLRLGIHESVVYGDRGFEPAYAAPFAILVGAQSLAGDSDNLAFGFDLTYRPAAGMRIFMAAFLDDLSKLNPGSFSNQLGLQFGAFWVDPLGISDTDLQAEYVRIEPYTYAHNFDINAYTHFGTPLGYPLGPNTDRLSFVARWWMTDWVKLSVALQRTREADNYLDGTELINAGGDENQGRRPSDPSERVFLAGDRLTSRALSIATSLEPYPALRFRFEYTGQHQSFTTALDGIPVRTSIHVIRASTELNAF